MARSNLDLKFTITCTCGREVNTTQENDGNITVEPCEHCMKTSHDEGVEEGERNGQE